MDSGSLDLRALVDGLSAAELEELRDAVASRLCREKYGADTIEGLLTKWDRGTSCPSCHAEVAWSDGSNGRRPRLRCAACGTRFSLLTGTIFANAKLPLTRS